MIQWVNLLMREGPLPLYYGARSVQQKALHLEMFVDLIWLVLTTHPSFVPLVKEFFKVPFSFLAPSFHRAVARRWGQPHPGLCWISLRGVCISIEMINKVSFSKIMTSAWSWYPSLSLESWGLIFIINLKWETVFPPTASEDETKGNILMSHQDGLRLGWIKNTTLGDLSSIRKIVVWESIGNIFLAPLALELQTKDLE